jgi:hypothetical protein
MDISRASVKNILTIAPRTGLFLKALVGGKKVTQWSQYCFKCCLRQVKVAPLKHTPILILKIYENVMVHACHLYYE